MAVRIRLTRVGATKRPAYRVIAIDQRRSRDGRALEILGYYDPLTEPATVQLQSDRISAWIGNGAQPSDTVVRLMRQAEREAASPPSEKPKRPAKSKGIVASSPKAATRAKAAAKPKAAAAKPKAAAAKPSAEDAPATAASEADAGADTTAAAEATESPQSTDATDTAADAAADSGVEPAVVEEAAADEAPAPAPDGETKEPEA
ncbi:MAG: 30S ribosomal protein S16 [Chloroflexota bacterium]